MRELLIVGGIVAIGIVIFIYCACRVAGEADRKSEERINKHE